MYSGHDICISLNRYGEREKSHFIFTAMHTQHTQIVNLCFHYDHPYWQPVGNFHNIFAEYHIIREITHHSIATYLWKTFT